MCELSLEIVKNEFHDNVKISKCHENHGGGNASLI